MADQDLQRMKTGEVAEKARQAGVQNTENMNKQEMIDALSRQQDPSQPGRGGGPGDTPAPEGTDPGQWKNIPGNQS